MTCIYIYREISVFSDQALDLSDTGCVCLVLDFFLIVVPDNMLRCPTKLITREKRCPADLTVLFWMQQEVQQLIN